MSLLSLSMKHGRTLEDARSRLESVVQAAQTQFGPMIERTEWNTDHTAVGLFAPGVQVDMRVDAEEVHVTADVPLLSQVLSRPLMSSLKSLLEDKFQKRIPSQ